jgi:hypothetical protein
MIVSSLFRCVGVGVMHNRLLLAGCSLLLAWLLLSPRLGIAAAIEGRVVDAAGQPVAGAEVHVWHKTKDVYGRNENQRVEINDAAVWTTDGEGRFETPDIGDALKEMRVVAQAKDMLAGRSGWLSLEHKGSVDVGTIVLRRLRTIAGRVADRQGRAVAGVTVFNSGDAHQRVETKTDSNGRFCLPDLPEGQVCLFAEHPEYRFTGLVVVANDAPVELRLSRRDEYIEPIQTLPPPLPPGEMRELARQVLNPFVGAATGADDDAKTSTMFALGCIDWQAAVERLDAMTWADAEERERVRAEIVVDAVRLQRFDDWSDVKALVESAVSPESKAACYTYAARHFFAEDRARQEELLGEALLHTQAIVETKRRALEIARVALALFDLGRDEEGKRLAHEALAILDPLPVSHRVSWNVTGTVAEALGRFDLDAARVLLDRLHYNGIFAYELGRLACDIAPRDAALAERLWNDSSAREGTEQADLTWRDRELSAPICYRLALTDPVAARRVAGTLGGGATRIAALAAVAQALAESDPAAARRLARENLAGLPPTGSSGLRFDYLSTEAAAVCQWLPLLERIDADLGREFFWRAISLRPLRPIDDQLDDEVEQAELHLIALLARYDRRLAQGLLAPYEARAEELIQTEWSNSALVFTAAGLIDPRRSASLLERLSPGKEGERRGVHGWVLMLWTAAMAGPSQHADYEGRYNDPSRYESW